MPTPPPEAASDPAVLLLWIVAVLVFAIGVLFTYHAKSVSALHAEHREERRETDQRHAERLASYWSAQSAFKDKVIGSLAAINEALVAVKERMRA